MAGFISLLIIILGIVLVIVGIVRLAHRVWVSGLIFLIIGLLILFGGLGNFLFRLVYVN